MMPTARWGPPPGPGGGGGGPGGGNPPHGHHSNGLELGEGAQRCVPLSQDARTSSCSHVARLCEHPPDPRLLFMSLCVSDTDGVHPLRCRQRSFCWACKLGKFRPGVPLAVIFSSSKRQRAFVILLLGNRRE